jgi:hypothetical protein
MMMAQPAPAIGARAGGAAAPASHLRIIDAVERFKAQIDVKNPSKENLSQQGQFFWGRQVGEAVRSEIAAIAALPDAGDFPAKAFRAHVMAVDFPDEAGPALRAVAAAASARRSPTASPRVVRYSRPSCGPR